MKRDALTFFLILYWWMAAMYALCSGAAGFKEWLRRQRSQRPCSIWEVLTITSIFLCSAALWPLVGLYVEHQRERQRATRPAPRRAAGTSVQSCPPVHVPRTWRERGWLIMVRARHQKSLTKSKGWMAKLKRLREGRRPCSLDTCTTTASSATTSGGPVDACTLEQDASEIELAEEGMSNTSFRTAVVAVVEIEEEGLFRNIITYL